MSFDFVVVGGRVAGCAIAWRLGRAGKKVLVLDRQTFPSAPAVPSSPALHPGTMLLLDEMGIAESAYQSDTGRMYGMMMVAEGFGVEALIAFPKSFGRDYFYGVAREDFDAVLWRHLASLPSVERREGFFVSGVVRDAQGRVCGVRGHGRDAPEEQIAAKWVIGADGRYSAIAKAIGARVIDDQPAHTSTVYYCDWEGAEAAHPDLQAGQIVTDMRGTNIVSFLGANGRVRINTHQRSDLVADACDDPLARYMDTLMRFPTMQRRLKSAKPVSKLIGIKRIGNRYMDHGVPGCVLVGDAWHHKDPVDGQGIYDALLEAKILAPLLLDEALSDAAVLARYLTEARAATLPMFKATMKRLENELWGSPPRFVVKTLIRWMLNDPEFHRTYARFTSRELRDPAALRSPMLMLRAMLRGINRDLRSPPSHVRR